MPTFQRHPEYLYVDIDGVYNLKYFLDCIDRIAARCREEKVGKVLVDLHVSGNPSILDRYHLGVAIANVWGSSIQGAIVGPRSIINRMAETVAHNRGARIQVFFDRLEAKTWLGVSDHAEAR